MKTARACLNAVLDRGMQCEVEKNDARAALNAIEEHPLLVGALRNLLKFPENTEAIFHAARVLDAAEKSAARLAALAAPKEEFGDLV